MVIDGSRGLADWAKPLAGAILDLKSRGASVYVAAQEAYEPHCESIDSCMSEFARHMVFQFGGGSARAISDILDRIDIPGTIVWLHGPQPIHIYHDAVPTAHVNLRRGGIEIVAIPLVPGVNETLNELVSLSSVRTARLPLQGQGTIAERLRELLFPTYRFERTARKARCASGECGEKAERRIDPSGSIVWRPDTGNRPCRGVKACRVPADVPRIVASPAPF